MKKIHLLFIIFIFLVGCKEKQSLLQTNFKTKNVLIIVVDGPRWSETWGDTTYQYIPRRSSMLSEGVLCTNFRNNGITATNPGHAAICTGNYDNLANNGSQLPSHPTIFQEFLKQSGLPKEKACIVTTKDKLEVLNNSAHPDFNNQYLAYTDCGNNGNGSGYREDYITFDRSKAVLKNLQPNLMLINFKEPDNMGHRANWTGYLEGIKTTDEYVYQLWNFIQTINQYKNQTTLIVTNDHGRHLNNVSDGYRNHGDACEGCRHIEFFAISPDFKKNVRINTAYEQIDIASTVAYLLGFQLTEGTGKVMTDIFE